MTTAAEWADETRREVTAILVDNLRQLAATDVPTVAWYLKAIDAVLSGESESGDIIGTFPTTPELPEVEDLQARMVDVEASLSEAWHTFVRVDAEAGRFSPNYSETDSEPEVPEVEKLKTSSQVDVNLPAEVKTPPESPTEAKPVRATTPGYCRTCGNAYASKAHRDACGVRAKKTWTLQQVPDSEPESLEAPPSRILETAKSTEPEAEAPGFKCERCGHEWARRKGVDPAGPQVCPSCKSAFWATTPRVRVQEQPIDLIADAGKMMATEEPSASNEEPSASNEEPSAGELEAIASELAAESAQGEANRITLDQPDADRPSAEAAPLPESTEVRDNGYRMATEYAEVPPKPGGHVHRWSIQPPNGPTSKGTCSGCGETRTFRNSVDADQETPEGVAARTNTSSLYGGPRSPKPAEAKA